MIYKLFTKLIADISAHKLSYLILLFAVAFGAYSRFHHLVDYAVFTYDQGRDMLVVWDIVVNHKPTLIGPVTGVQGVFLGPFFYYFLVVPFIFSGGHPLSGAVATAIVGVATVPFSYFVALKLFNRSTAIITSIIFALSPFLVFYSRFAWNPNILPIIALAFYFSLVRWCQGKKNYIYPLSFSVAIALQTEAASAFFYIPTVLIAWAIFRPKVTRKALVYSLLILFIIFSPLVLFDLKHGFLNSKSLLKFIFGNRETGLITTQSIGQRRTLLFEVFSKTFYYHLPRIDLVLVWGTFVFAIWQILKTISNRGKHIPLKVASIWFITNIVGLVLFYPGLVFEHFLISLVVVLILVASYFLSSVSTKLGFFGKMVAFMLLFLMILSVLPTFRFIANGSEDTSRRVSYNDQIAVLDYIYQNSQGRDFSLNVYTPSAIDYSYQYLLKWYTRSKKIHLPVADSRLTYLIIEPEPTAPPTTPTSFDKWYVEAKSTGILVERINISGGLVVEKRVK